MRWYRLKVLQSMFSVGDISSDAELRRMHAWYLAVLERPSVQATMIFDKDPELQIEVGRDAAKK